MTITSNTDDQLSKTASSGFSANWDWKSAYAAGLNEDGLERFAQYSATPDTTLLFASSARFTSVNPASLTPIGMCDNISMSTNPTLARLFEIGSNRSFFTRNKSMQSLQLTRMLADQDNVLEALSKQAYRPSINSSGSTTPGAESPNPGIKMNLDSEYFNIPFGLLLLFKTRGGGTSGTGKNLSALYLEYCMFSSYQFGIASQSPVIQENVSIEFDRVVPVSIS